MSLICERGHRPPRGTRPTRCTTKVGRGVECASRFEEEPEVLRCGTCERGIIVDGWCSFCGADEATHGEQFGHTCGLWFDTLAEWQDHVYGPAVQPFSPRGIGVPGRPNSG